jgi:iron complex transport system substrate-binding protein
MAGGNWMPELVKMTGGENLFGATGQLSPWLDWTRLLSPTQTSSSFWH